MKNFKILALTSLLAGCSAYTDKPTSFTLPTSNKAIDVVLHRSDVRFSDCGTLVVIQTYDEGAKMIDSQQARGNAFHCAIIPSMIEAGGRVGAAVATNPAVNNIANSVNNFNANINKGGYDKYRRDD